MRRKFSEKREIARKEGKRVKNNEPGMEEERDLRENEQKYSVGVPEDVLAWGGI